MTLRKIFDLGLVNDNTEVWVRDSDMRVLVHADWKRDLVLEFLDEEFDVFTWQDDGNLYVDLKRIRAI